jgi:hypothetical protein
MGMSDQATETKQPTDSLAASIQAGLDRFNSPPAASAPHEITGQMMTRRIYSEKDCGGLSPGEVSIINSTKYVRSDGSEYLPPSMCAEDQTAAAAR